MKKITRKLRLLHQIYLFNIGDLAALESSSQYAENYYLKKVNKSAFYFNPNDHRLIISCLPMNKIDNLFQQVLLNLLARDRQLPLNSKLLKIISTQLPSADIENILSQTNNTLTTHLDMCSILIQYPIHKIIAHLKWLYLKDNNHKLVKQTIARFKPIDYDKNLEAMFINIEINQIIEKLYQTTMPNINEVISEFNQRSTQSC